MSTNNTDRRAGLTVLERAVYRGPHLFSSVPMVRLQVDLGLLEGWPTDRLAGFQSSLLEILPGLANHGCSYRKPGGLVRRMAEGTWLGHVIEHVALELQTLAGHAAARGKTRSVCGRTGVYNIMFVYQDEAVGLAAGEYAVRLVESLLPPHLRGLRGVAAGDTAFSISSALDDLRQLVRKSSLGPTTAALVAEARRRHIPVRRLNDQSFVRMGWGRRSKVIRASITSETSIIAVEAAGDKALTKALLRQAALPTPAGAVVSTLDEAIRESARMRGPLVVKPLNGNHGRGVTLNVVPGSDVQAAFSAAARHSRRVIIEEQYAGRDYRVLVIGGRVVAVAERTPAQVTGDGVHTIAELIERVNADPRRGDGHAAVMTRIAVDEALTVRLAGLGLALGARPAPGRSVQLLDTANLSTGGTSTDRTDVIHPDNVAIAERAAAVIGLDVAGIDFITGDIGQSAHEHGGGIVEINAAPGFRMHLAPSEGLPRDVARPVIERLFPRGQNGRIPVVAITGTNGKSTTVRMVGHILAAQGNTVGMTTTVGMQIGSEVAYRGDASGPKSARTILADPTVDVAVLETARGGILREGLGFDYCDVGAVLNIAPDHLGLKGIDTVKDLAAVKSIVVEAVHRRGLSVLNADDPLTVGMARHAGGRIAYFSLVDGAVTQPNLRRHITNAGMAAVLETTDGKGHLVLYEKGERTSLIAAEEIPATLGGLASFNVANALAAILIARGLKVPATDIASSLAGFTSSFESVPGRLNVHDAHGFRIILDYAHNPAGLQALGDLIHKLRPQYRRVIGAVSIPGDRRDEDIDAMGRLAATLFDQIVFREKPDGRGREPGEVCRRLREGALATGVSPDVLHCIPGETAAMEYCLRQAGSGDLVVLLPTEVTSAWEQVLNFDPSHGDERVTARG